MLIKLKDGAEPTFVARAAKLDQWMHHFKFSDCAVAGYYKYHGLAATDSFVARAAAEEKYQHRLAIYHSIDHSIWEEFLRSAIDAMSLGSLDACSVIDIASGTGRNSFLFHRFGFGQIQSSEIRPSQCDQQRLILEHSVEFGSDGRISIDNCPHSADSAEFLAHYSGRQYDVVASLGLLYHLENPIRHLEIAKRLSKRYVLIHSLTHIGDITPWVWRLTIEPPEVVTKATSGISWTPHYHSVPALASSLGFKSCKILYPAVYARGFPDFATFPRIRGRFSYWIDRFATALGLETLANNSKPDTMKRYYTSPHNFAYLLEV